MTAYLAPLAGFEPALSVPKTDVIIHFTIEALVADLKTGRFPSSLPYYGIFISAYDFGGLNLLPRTPPEGRNLEPTKGFEPSPTEYKTVMLDH